MRTDGIYFLFFVREQVKEQSSQLVTSQFFSYEPIARTLAADGAAMRKNDQRARLGRDCEFTGAQLR